MSSIDSSNLKSRGVAPGTSATSATSSATSGAASAGPTMHRTKVVTSDAQAPTRKGARGPQELRFDEVIDNVRFRSVYTPELMNRARANGFDANAVRPAVPDQPVILSDRLKTRLVDAGNAIMAQLQDPANIAKMRASIPADRFLPNVPELPHWTCIDFAITQAADGTLEPKLIELQAHPSVVAGIHLYSRALTKELEGTALEGLSHLYGGHTDESLTAHLRTVVLGKHAPERVVMLDVDPAKSITAFDFAATKELTGVDTVSVDEVYQRGNKLYRQKDGVEMPIDRIYSRLLFHDLRNGAGQLKFDWTSNLDVEWAPHPTWQEIWSKHSMLHLDHPSVPTASRLSEVNIDDLDLSRFILKPFDAYSGKGFIKDVTREVVDAIPAEERHNWCLQTKVAYASFLPTADGSSAVRAEVRLMYIRGDQESELKLATSFARLSRGDMMNAGRNGGDTSTGMTPVLFKS